MTVTSTSIGTSGFLPPKVVEVAKETIRNFQHSKKVGNYLLGNTIGEGSFAKVKEALHIPTGEKVAVKVIDKKKVKEDSYVRKNLRREGKILQMIRHPNVIQLYEIMETENSYYLVTDLCKGGDLMDFICMKKRLEERETKRFIRQIISALDYLHRLGILHRDLKIENLLLDENRDIKIIDFGLSNCIKVSKTKDGVRAQEHLVTQCGSPAYAAPELLGRKKYGPQVDVWSIGINMYAMLTGNLPFTVDPFNIKTLHNKMMNGHMNPIPDNISKDCRDLLKKFLNPDPDKRISLSDAMKHPWIAESRISPLEPLSCPNKLKTEDLDESIMKHMVESQGFRMSEIVRFVTGNTPSPATSMYHILHRKLTTYLADMRVQGKISACDTRLNGTNRVPYIFQHSRLGSTQNHTTNQRHYTSHHLPFAARPVGQNKASSTNKQNKHKLIRKVPAKVHKMCNDQDVIDLNYLPKDDSENKPPEVDILEFTNIAHPEPEISPVQTTADDRKHKYMAEIGQKYQVVNTVDREMEKNGGLDLEPFETPKKLIRRGTNKPSMPVYRQYINPNVPQGDILRIIDNAGDGKEQRDTTNITNTHQIKIHRFTSTTKKTEEPENKILNMYVRKTDIKMTDGGKILGLAFTPCSRIQTRRFVQNGARFSFDRTKVISRPQIKHHNLSKTGGDNATLTEAISPLSSYKQVSSRATTHSMRSVSVKDSHAALPCISPTNTSRNQ